MLLRVSDVSFSFRGSTIVDSLDFEIAEGQFVGLVGPSGSGKSTTLKLINGMLTPDVGAIKMDDVPLDDQLDRRIATVWQGRALFPHLNVFENLSFGLKVRKFKVEAVKERVESVSKDLGIEHLLGRSLDNLSGGELQRVAIARAMIVRPRLLLLDEPFTGLDYLLQVKLQSDLKKVLINSQQSALLVSHDYSTVIALAEIVLIMCNGVIVQRGSPEEVRKHPLNAFVARLVGWRNVIPINTPHSLQSDGLIAIKNGDDIWRGENRIQKHGKHLSLFYAIPSTAISWRNETHDCTAYANLWAVEEHEHSVQLHFVGPNQTQFQVSTSMTDNLPSVGEKVLLSWRSSDALILS